MVETSAPQPSTRPHPDSQEHLQDWPRKPTTSSIQNLAINIDLRHKGIRMALRKDPSRIRTSGPEYEWKFAALVYLRAYRRGLRFLLASNVEGAKPFDDVFLRLQWKDCSVERAITYLIQLKHAERLDKTVSVENIQSEKGDFSIKKYFELYKRALSSQSVAESGSCNNDILLHEENINNCRFIIYTTKNVPHRIGSADNSSTDFPFSELLSTGNKDDIFSFCESDEYVWNLLENDDSCELYRRQFLPRLRIFARQQRVVELDRLIAEEISEIFNGAVPRSVGVAFTEYFRIWWERDDSECITHASALLENIVKYEIMNNRRISEVPIPESQCEVLAKRMDDKDICYIAFPELFISERYAFCKFILDMDYSGRYIILNDSEINTFPLTSIVITCKKLCDAVAINTDESSEKIQPLLTLLLDSDIRKVIVITLNIDFNFRTLLRSFDRSYVEIEEHFISSSPAPDPLNEKFSSNFTKWNIHKRSSLPGSYYNLSNLSLQCDSSQEESHILHSASQFSANVDFKFSQMSHRSRSLPTVRLSDIDTDSISSSGWDNYTPQTWQENSESRFVKNTRRLMHETQVLKAMSVEVRDVKINAKIPVLRVRSFREDANV